MWPSKAYFKEPLLVHEVAFASLKRVSALWAAGSTFSREAQSFPTEALAAAGTVAAPWGELGLTQPDTAGSGRTQLVPAGSSHPLQGMAGPWPGHRTACVRKGKTLHKRWWGKTRWDKQPCEHQADTEGRWRSCSRPRSRDSPATRGEAWGYPSGSPAACGGDQAVSPWKTAQGAGGCVLMEAVAFRIWIYGYNGYMLLHAGADSLKGLQPVGTPCWSIWTLKDWQKGKMGDERSNGEELIWTDHSAHSPFPCVTWGWGKDIKESGMK